MIRTVRGLRVVLDHDIAELYGVEAKRLNQAVRRNRDRFPDDFMLQLTADESTNLRSQCAISSSGHGGQRHLPLAFTEQGVAMLSGVLRSPRAIQVNVEIMRAFVRLRRLHGEHADLAKRLDDLEQRYDGQFKVVFDAIRALMTPPEPKARKIGFEKTR